MAVEKLWVWMTVYPDGTTGTVGAVMPGIGNTSLTTRREDMARGFMRTLAGLHAKATGQRVWLRCYHDFTDEEPINDL